MNIENKKPVNFNWVSARRLCSLREVCEALRLRIRDDVEVRNSSLPENTDPSKPTLKLAEGGNTIKVYWHEPRGEYAHLFVEFTLTPQAIIVKDNEQTLFEATIGLNDDGDCKMIIAGKQYDSWQTRRKALERLMFDSCL